MEGQLIHPQLFEIYKAAAPGAGAVVAALIVAIGTFLTAKVVTARLETQKQEMELYKVLFTERIAAGKRITELAGELHLSLADHMTRLQLRMEKSPESIVSGQNAIIELMKYRQSTRWLLGEKVYIASQKVLSCARTYNESHAAGRLDVMQLCLEEVLVQVGALNEAVSETMPAELLNRFQKRKLWWKRRK